MGSGSVTAKKNDAGYKVVLAGFVDDTQLAEPGRVRIRQ
jgi:hypothetical protein